MGEQGTRQRRTRGLAAGGAVLGLATAVASALGYAYTVVLARAFEPADYGALVALLGAGLIGTIPAAGLQYAVARRTVALRLAEDHNDGPALRLAGLTGAALLVAATAVAPVAEGWLHLDGLAPVVLLAAALIPLTVAGAFQGALMGHRRFAALGVLYVVSALTRLAAGVLTAAAGLGVGGAMGTLALAAAASTAIGWLLTGPRSWRPVPDDPAGPLLRNTVRACSTVAGIIVLTNTDVLLARHYLPADDSGAYGVASLFAKAVLWTSQFVAQAAYPSLARPEGRRRLLLRTVGVTAGLGLAAVAVTAGLGGTAVRVITGDDGGVSPGLVTAFAALGVVWALAQVLLLAAVAVGDRRPGRLLWGLIAVEAAVVAVGPHRTAAEILTVCALGVAAFVVVAGALEWTARPGGRAPEPGPVPSPAAEPAPQPGPADPAVGPVPPDPAASPAPAGPPDPAVGPVPAGPADPAVGSGTERGGPADPSR